MTTSASKSFSLVKYDTPILISKTFGKSRGNNIASASQGIPRQWAVVGPVCFAYPCDPHRRYQFARRTRQETAGAPSKGNRHLSDQRGTLFIGIRWTDPWGDDQLCRERVLVGESERWNQDDSAGVPDSVWIFDRLRNEEGPLGRAEEIRDADKDKLTECGVWRPRIDCVRIEGNNMGPSRIGKVQSRGATKGTRRSS